MAKSNNLPAKKYKAGERTERHLRFVFSASDSEGSYYIDIAKALSAVNRRFYRQGLYYYVSNVTIHNSSNAWVSIHTLPDTYMTKNAWVRVYRAWQKMQGLAQLAGGPQSVPGKYRDFKVAMTGAHAFGSTLDVDYGMISPNPISCDEWSQSRFTTDDPENVTNFDHQPDQFYVHMVGPHNGSDNNWVSIGALQSYGTTRREIHGSDADVDLGTGGSDPTAFNDPISSLFDAGDSHDEILADLAMENDEVPYDHDRMVGEANDDDCVVVAQCATGGASGSSTVGRAGGFCAPLGLVKVVVDESPNDGSNTIGDIEVNFEVVPGTYHGVYAERIL